MNSTLPAFLDPRLPPHGSIGVLFVGVVLALVLYGITCVQAIQYFRRFSSDALLLKLAVVLVWTLETTNNAFLCHNITYYTIEHRGVLPYAIPLPWSAPIQSTTNGIIACTIHSFFGRKIWILSGKNLWVTSTMIFLSAGQLIFGIVHSLIYMAFLFPYGAKAVRVVTLLNLGLTALADSTMTIFLVYYLNGYKTPSNVKSTSVVNTIIFHVINNGLLCSCLALIAFIFIIVKQATWITPATCGLVSRTYFNTLMTSLNSRPSLREKMNGPNQTYLFRPEYVGQQIIELDRRAKVTGSVIEENSGRLKRPAIEVEPTGEFSRNELVRGSIV